MIYLFFLFIYCKIFFYLRILLQNTFKSYFKSSVAIWSHLNKPKTRKLPLSIKNSKQNWFFDTTTLTKIIQAYESNVSYFCPLKCVKKTDFLMKDFIYKKKKLGPVDSLPDWPVDTMPTRVQTPEESLTIRPPPESPGHDVRLEMVVVGGGAWQIGLKCLNIPTKSMKQIH